MSSIFTGGSSLQWLWFPWRFAPELSVSDPWGSQEERVEDVRERPQSVALQCQAGEETSKAVCAMFDWLTRQISKPLTLLLIFQVSQNPKDEDRRFILSYFLANDTISIFERPTRNSGIIGGKFLEKTRVPKPGSTVQNPEFYSPADFAIGASIKGEYLHVFSGWVPYLLSETKSCNL